MVMDAKLRCPAMESTRFVIVVGDIEEIHEIHTDWQDTKLQYQSVWEVTKTGTIGKRIDKAYT